MKRPSFRHNPPGRPGLRPLVLLAMLLLLPAALSALIGFGPGTATFRIIDGVQYQSTQLISLDIEIITPDPDLTPHIMVPGRRFNVRLTEPQHLKLKTGQLLSGVVSGAIDDLGSGRIMMSIDPASLTLIEETADSRDISYSDWEPYFDWLPHLKVAFIAFWWLVAGVLVYRRDVQPTPLI